MKHIDADDLILYKVSISFSPQLAEHAAALGLNELLPLDELSGVFANGLLDAHVHVVVEMVRGYTSYLSSLHSHVSQLHTDATS